MDWRIDALAWQRLAGWDSAALGGGTGHPGSGSRVMMARPRTSNAHRHRSAMRRGSSNNGRAVILEPARR